MKRPFDDGESAPKPKCGRRKVSLVLTRYPPMKDLGEDDIAVKRNTELLSKELERDKPRERKLCFPWLGRHTVLGVHDSCLCLRKSLVLLFFKS